MAEDKPCTVCGGKKSEHGPQTIHAYAAVEGDLTTPEQRRAADRMASPMIAPPAALAANPMALGRLVEVLLERSVIDTPDALYIAGFSAKLPNHPKFADPATGGN